MPGTTPGTTVARSYTYDSLDRLTKSASTTGATNAYGYDPAGNRTSASTTDKYGTTSTTAQFNAADPLTGETVTDPAGATQQRSYAYDGNSNRITRTIPGVPDTNYTYTPTGQPETVSQPGYTATRTYDGLGRATTETQDTGHGTPLTTTTLYNGLTPIQSLNSFGTTTKAADNLGHPATLTLVSNGTSSSEWAVTDRAGTTIAHTDLRPNTPAGSTSANATLDQLAEATDTGTQKFATTGWDGTQPGYTTQQSDPTAGLTNYHARALDNTANVFTGHDTWGGMLRHPQTRNHYTYVLNNPATLKDHLGHDPIEEDGTDWNAINTDTYADPYAGYADGSGYSPAPAYPDPYAGYADGSGYSPAPAYPDPYAGYADGNGYGATDVNGGGGGYIAPQPATPMQTFINNTIQTPAQTSPAQPQARHDDGPGWLPWNWSEDTWKVVGTVGAIVGGVALAATGVGLIADAFAVASLAEVGVASATAVSISEGAGTVAFWAGAAGTGLDLGACTFHHDSKACLGALVGGAGASVGAIGKWGSAAIAGDQGYRAGWDFSGAMIGAGGYAVDNYPG